MSTVTRDGRGRKGTKALRCAATLLASIALAGAAGCAATAPGGDGLLPASGIQLTAVQDTHDFGTVESGPVIAHTFKLKNHGPNTIDITSVSGACGCTAVLASTPRLAPGEEGGVEVALDTYKLAGPQAKTVVVRSTDVVRPELVLTLHGTVATDLKVAPGRIYLGRLPAGAVVSQHVDIELARPDVEITSVSTESGRFAVETAPLDAPQRGVRVRVTLLPTATTGAFDDRVIVSTTSARQPTVSIPVLGTIESQQVYARHRGGDTASR